MTGGYQYNRILIDLLLFRHIKLIIMDIDKLISCIFIRDTLCDHKNQSQHNEFILSLG